MTNQPPLFTARVARDGEWFVAFSLEFPEANGQGRTEDEALEQGLRSPARVFRIEKRPDGTFARVAVDLEAWRREPTARPEPNE